MRVLALDTALGACSAAVVAFPSGEVVASRSVAMDRGHAEALLPMVRDVIGESGGFGGLARIIATVGPGSFTGLRVALSAARSFGLALRVPVVGVSTLTAFAAPILATGPRTSVAVAIDARHGSVFFQSFWLDGKKAVGPALMTIEAAAATLSAGRVQLVGTGALAVAQAARAIGAEVLCDEEQAAAPDVFWVARLGAAADPAYAPPRPLYLRAASAVPQAGGRIPRVPA
ncbi:MAG: tRNA (adenosine(37)-N6)-threonylcarbamoyltransferase complex dimerization subunit type 1 TsaB [Proteobacteria bacterium]|nr:tRNA (adenosine(37)-N6)-threonylcarbamoyltransferase complex dimerization subunit type 1 TsaB [Pseudomonadota bacterium]